MKNMRIYLIALCALALSGGSILLSGSPASRAQSGGKDVVVTNTTANPVPVAVQGTANIAGSVSVSNTPSVNVANSPTVQLNNSASNPLSVRDVDNPAEHAYQTTILLTFGSHPNDCSAFPPVPVGKRLVIEYVSAFIRDGQWISRANLITQMNGSEASYELFPQLTNPRLLSDSPLAVAQQLRAYAEGNYSICFERNPSGPPSGRATVSGYLVDMP